MNKLKNGKGFTIIEVVLVLAIAGLIFLLVFLALPALQRGQRDTQRKSDLGRFTSQVTAFESNNQGQLPTNWATFTTQYMTANNQTWSDPSGGATYAITQQPAINALVPGVGQIFIYINARCDPSQASGLNTGSGTRSYAVKAYQEQGGFTCQST